jgi:hypothetical protein
LALELLTERGGSGAGSSLESVAEELAAPCSRWRASSARPEQPWEGAHELEATLAMR